MDLKCKICGFEPQFLDHIFQNKLLNEAEIDYSSKPVKYMCNEVEHYYHTEQLDSNVLLKEQAY